MFMRNLLGFFLIILPAYAFSAYQSLSVLKEKAESFVAHSLELQANDKLEIHAGRIDGRLRLRQCKPQKLEIFNPFPDSATAKKSIGIRCAEEYNHWTIYVPVKVKIMRSVVVLNHPLTQGQTIKQSDIRLEERDLNQLKQGYLTELSQAINQTCKRNMTEGQIIRAELLQAPHIIRKGERVIIEAINGSIKVTMDAISLDDGSLNDIIKVKNLRGGHVVEAQVIGTKKVRAIF